MSDPLSLPAAALIEASVVGVLIREFARQPVLEQAKAKARLETALRSAIAPLPVAARVVLDESDGFAIAVVGDPDAALGVAENLQASVAELPVCIGLNQGPVKVVEEAAGAPQLLGDGIAAAMTLARLATRNRILLSRSFRDALERAAPHRAAGIAPVGAFTDASVRNHEVFTVEPAGAAARRRRVLIGASLAALGLLAAGIGIRVLRAGASRPATIVLDIVPDGQVYIDGELKGASPPLRRVEVVAGQHAIEVRNSSNPPLKLTVTVKPGQEMTVSHSFPVAKKGRRTAKDESFIERLRRKWGN